MSIRQSPSDVTATARSSTAAGWPQLCRCRLGQGQLANAEEEPEDREVAGRCDEWSDPGWYAQAEREVEDVGEVDLRARCRCCHRSFPAGPSCTWRAVK